MDNTLERGGGAEVGRFFSAGEQAGEGGKEATASGEMIGSSKRYNG